MQATKNQVSFFDQQEKVNLEKQRGIELVFAHADTYWKKEAAKQLYEVIQRKRIFTSDDVLIPLEAKGIVTKDNRAIAAILQAFNRTGMIASTDTFVRCARRSRHGAPIMQWTSNIYRKTNMEGE